MRNEYLRTGNPSVDFLFTHEVKGDIIPPALYKLVKKDSGNTDFLAIQILSNIIYWHRPTTIYDNNGEIVGYKKKFAGDLLQKSYEDYAELYDVSKRQVKASFDVLEGLGFIKRNFKTVSIRNGIKANNVLFIELCVEKLALIVDTGNKSASEKIMEEIVNEGPASVENNGYDIQFYVTPPTEKRNTNTNINPNNLTNNNLSIIPSQSEEEEMMDEAAYREILAENTELDALIREQPYSEEQYREYFEIMVDLVCYNRLDIKSKGQYYPASVVKSRMLHLRREHLEYVAEVYENYIGDIRDFYRHCASTLFRSYFEADNVIANKARNTAFNLGA